MTGQPLAARRPTDQFARDSRPGVTRCRLAADAALLDDPGLRDLVSPAPTLARALTAEDAFGLSTFADFADGRSGFQDLRRFSSDPNFAMLPEGDSGRTVVEPLSSVWRSFFLPSDIAGYRRRFKRYRQLASLSADRSQGWPEVKKRVDDTERELRESGPDGALSRLLTPAIESVLRSQTIALATRRRRGDDRLVGRSRRGRRRGAAAERRGTRPGERRRRPADGGCSGPPCRSDSRRSRPLTRVVAGLTSPA